MSALNEKMAEAVVNAETDTVNRLVEKALTEDYTAKNILNDGLVPGMDVVGQRMKTGKMFIPEVLRSARVMQGALEKLKPHLSEKESAGLGTVVIGTVAGDQHDIGKNLISMMLQGAGFNVIDLGTDVATKDFVEAVTTHQADILGMSALLTTTMPRMPETVEALEAAGIRDQVKIMAGGAPVTRNFVEEIGADAYAANAGSASEVAKSLVNGH
jgi:corrinoid protein of di/trimethylamine methyltransferase